MVKPNHPVATPENSKNSKRNHMLAKMALDDKFRLKIIDALHSKDEVDNVLESYGFSTDFSDVLIKKRAAIEKLSGIQVNRLDENYFKEFDIVANW